MTDEEWAEYKRTGMIPFKEQVFVNVHGDTQRADSWRGAAAQFLEQVKRTNVNDYLVLTRYCDLEDGTRILVRRNWNFYFVDIISPVHEASGKVLSKEALVPPLDRGQFYWVPGCKARYGFAEGKELDNGIPVKSSSESDTSNSGGNISFISTAKAGLPAPGISPNGIISRRYRICQLEGGDTDGDNAASLVSFSPANIITNGSCTISCIVRLREPILYDYSFTTKTNELDNGYTIHNPIKARVLTSDDGETWSATCPGSIAPLLGYLIPSRFSTHYINATYPWPAYNNNFLDNQVSYIGFREIATTCPNEPLMQSAYDSSSPYWDKVETSSDLKSYEGEYTDFWEENSEMQNVEPYKSFCKWKTPYRREYSDGTRVITHGEDGECYYGTVYSSEYVYKTISVQNASSLYIVGDEVTINTNKGTVFSVSDDSVTLITYTIFSIKDYQYKKYIYQSNSLITFGSQPFPVCHPQGYMMGINLFGLFWYNGNRILAGKLCDFESEYNIKPIISNELELDTFYHVCLTYNEDGNTNLYICKQGDEMINHISAAQSALDFLNEDGLSNSVPMNAGISPWQMVSPTDSSDPISEWFFLSHMDVGLVRFYHRELSRQEAQLLTREAFNCVFIADDFEAGTLVGNGYKPITV